MAAKRAVRRLPRHKKRKVILPSVRGVTEVEADLQEALRVEMTKEVVLAMDKEVLRQLSFDDDGTMVDGQHRLDAVKKTEGVGGNRAARRAARAT